MNRTGSTHTRAKRSRFGMGHFLNYNSARLDDLTVWVQNTAKRYGRSPSCVISKEPDNSLGM